MYSQEADLGISISINRNGNANAVVDEILNHLLGSEESALIRNTYPIPESLKQKFSGFYEFKSPKSKLLAFFRQNVGRNNIGLSSKNNCNTNLAWQTKRYFVLCRKQHVLS